MDEEFHLLLVGELRDLGFDRGRDDDGAGALRGGHLLDRLGVRVAGGGVGLVDVADIEHRLRGQQVQPLQDAQILGGDALEQDARRLAGLQQFERRLHHRQHGRRFLVLAGGALADLHDAALEAVEIGEHQLGLDRLGVGDGIDACPRHG